jgi:hypothetical protein
MKSVEHLRGTLKKIDRRGYKAYKDIRGEYSIGDLVLAIDHVGPGHDVIRMVASPPGLRPYEASVMGVLQARGRDGVVPVGALGVGSREYARGWWRSFRSAVIADAQAGGLSRDLWDARTLWILAAIGLLPAPFLALAGGDFWLGVFPVVLVAAIIGAIHATRRPRATPAGAGAGARAGGGAPAPPPPPPGAPGRRSLR